MPRHYLLKADQKAATGFTDLFIVTEADLTETTDNTDQSVTLDALEFGDLVGYNALIEIRTAFDAATVSADNACTVSLGVTGAVTQIIGASAITAGGAGTAAKTAYATAAGGAAYPTPTGGKNLLVNFDVTDADGSLAEYTTGELWIWVNISRYSQRAAFQA
jgi:hypothetical protein